MNLEEIREKIDIIDRQMLELFCSRMELVKNVAEYKIEKGLPVFHPEREQQILSEMKLLGGEEYGEYAQAVFQQMMDVSRQMQEKMIKVHETLNRSSDGAAETETAEKSRRDQ